MVPATAPTPQLWPVVLHVLVGVWVVLGPRGWEEAWGWQEWLAGVIQGLEDYD